MFIVATASTATVVASFYASENTRWEVGTYLPAQRNDSSTPVVTANQQCNRTISAPEIRLDVRERNLSRRKPEREQQHQQQQQEKFRYLHFPVFILVVNTNIIVMIVIITTNSIEIPAAQWCPGWVVALTKYYDAGDGGPQEVWVWKHFVGCWDCSC